MTPDDEAPHADPAFAPVAKAFSRLVGAKEGGGALTVRVRGRDVVDLWTGTADAAGHRPWTPDTVSISFSTTKGIASTVVHRLAERGLLAYDEPVATYWPEFAAGGKDRVTVRDVLTHRAGLSSARAVAEQAEDLLDHLGMEDRLAARTVDAPTERSAYHAITYGWLLAGIARRVTGGSGLAELAGTEIAEPLGIDGLHIGVPEAARERVAQPVGSALRQLGSLANVLLPLTGRARLRPGRTALDALMVPGFHRLFEGPEPPIWTTEMPAVNGVFTARALARVYGALANGGTDAGATVLEPATVRELGRVQMRAADSVLALNMRWRLGYHQALGAAGPKAFGHYGYGGSGGWADPDLGLSVGYVTNRIGSMSTPMGDLDLPRMSRIIRQCAVRAA